MKKKLISFALMLGIAGLVLSGCSQGGGIYDGKGQVYREVIPQDMSTLDNVLATDEVSFNTYNQVFEGLYTLDGKDKIQPGVAKSKPKKSNGGKTLTIDLRKNAKWSNGDPVTANDFVFAWKKALKPETASEYAYIMYDLKNAQKINEGKMPADKLGVKALNKYKLQIELNKPLPYFEQMLAFGTYMPQNEKIAKKYGKRYGTTANKVVYNGPFKVKDWKVEDKILLEKNEDYWDKKAVKLDKVSYKILKDQQAGASLYDTGSADVTEITSEQVDKYKKNPALFKRLFASTFFIKLNEKQQKEFKNKDMRYAIAQSINKKDYVDTVLNNGSSPFDGFTAKETAILKDGKDYASLVKSPLKYNTNEAKSHFEKAKKALGKDKFTFTLNTQDTASSKISAQFIKSQIEKNLPGVTINIKQLPFKQRVTAELSMNYSMSISGWGPDYPDPMAFLDTMTTGNAQNNTDWGSKHYDDMLKEANGPLLKKPDERINKLKDAEEFMLSEAPVAPLYQQGRAYLKNPQIKGVVYHQVGGKDSLKHAYIDKSIDRETGKKKKDK
ncbi:peptide ABC transporter substrate-binding protein [Staphylococcus debuckii]|uniref:peptide ABC transporter substrate-binding protein n=1 Tax=Staphylococcus debuckii TaxID=2044912 RepID=UPI000F435BEA|nr:peptide ABC transporter substrate-binding protein [Staphylococcus debuckii]AYU54764.1 peptide ABC transporter substrate-binding protein [Staphylococcus debuckii]